MRPTRAACGLQFGTPASASPTSRSRLVRRAAIAQVESKPSGDYVVRLADGRELAGSRRYRKPLLDT